MRKFQAPLRVMTTTILAFTLIFQLSIGTALAERDSVARTRIRFSPINLFAPGLPSSPTYRTSASGLVPSLESQITALEQAIENASSPEEAARLAPLPKDIAKLAGHKHRIYRTEGTGSALRFVVDREIPLDRIVADNPSVNMVNPTRELRIAYNSAAKELEIQRYTKINDVDTLTDGHVIPNVEITTQPGNHVLQDANSIMFATTEGVRAILGVDLTQYVFKASIPSSLLIEAPMGRTITRLEYVNPGSTPREVVNSNEILEADLGLTLNSDEDKLHIISRRELITRLGLWKTIQLYMLSLANPDVDNAHVVAQSLSQNVEEVRSFISARDAMLESGEGSDLQNAALANMARNTDFITQASLISRGQSNNAPTAFETLAQSPRHVFGATGEWIQNFSQIESRREADVAAGRTAKSWKEYLIESIRNPDAEVSQALAQAAADQPQIVQSKTKNVINLVKKIATPRRMILLASFFAFDLANITYEGALVRVAMSTLTNIFGWTMQVPGLGALITSFESLPGYLQEPWALSRLAVATAAVLALRPLSMIAAQRYARKQGNDWSQKKAFFTYGLRLYSRVVYPVQKLFWEKIARQHQLYAALEAGLSPFDRAAWVNPFNSNNSDSSRLQQALEEESTRKSRAMILAAALVSEKSRTDGHPIDPATLMLLLNAPQGEAANTLLAALGSATGESMWMDVTNQTISALTKLTDGGSGAVNEQSINEYHTVFSRIASELRSQTVRVQGSRIEQAQVALQRFTRSRYLEFKRMTSKNILPFLLFGSSQLKIYNTYRNAEVDDNTADIAEHQYRDDYDFSTLFYAGADAATFGAMTTGNVAASAEILANQSEQVFIYGVQLGYDVLTTGTLNPLSNPYAPLTDDLYAEQRARQQTFLEATRELGSAMFNPDTPSALATHRQYMTNTLTGFQVRMAAGTLARAGGLAAIGIASGAIGLETLTRVVSAIPLQATALLAKIGITTAGPGYAVVWPYVSHNMRVLKNSAAVNEQALKLAHYLIDSGLRTNSAERLSTGVATMLGLYKTHNTALPERFTSVEANQYSAELSRELMEYSLSHVPAPTQYSEKMAKFLNVGMGALVSTILYVSLSKTLFDPNAAPLALFSAAVTSFAFTFAGLALAQPLVQQALRVGHNLVDRCKEALTPKNKK